MKIDELFQLKDNSPVKGKFLISEINLRPLKKEDSFFLTFVLQDKTGKIQGKIWESVESARKKLKNDTVISIQGKINFYNGKNQVVLEQFETEDDSLTDFLPAASESPKMMLNSLIKILVDEITNEDLKVLLQSYLTDKQFIDEFKLCPGGKGVVHHAYSSGLLEHTLSVVKICLFYSKQFEDMNINKEQLLMGGFLHDLGKIQSYQFKTTTIQMTDLGRLHGHTILGYYSFLKKLELQTTILKKEELKRNLGHMILSHHGDDAFILPMTIEANLLSHADSVDADVSFINQKITQDAQEDWTQFDTLKNRMFYSKKAKMIQRKSLLNF